MIVSLTILLLRYTVISLLSRSRRRGESRLGLATTTGNGQRATGDGVGFLPRIVTDRKRDSDANNRRYPGWLSNHRQPTSRYQTVHVAQARRGEPSTCQGKARIDATANCGAWNIGKLRARAQTHVRRQIGRFVSKSKSPKRPRKIYPKLIFYPTTFSSTYT